MRLISLFFILILSAACGKESSTGGLGGGSDKGLCNLNGTTVSCGTMKTADGEGIDLLESLVDVPVRIQNSEIVFQGERANKNLGRRIECGITIKSGDSFKYVLNGNRLLITEGGSSYEMQRLNEGSTLNGTWVWKGYVDNGTHMIRQMTILENNRAILKYSCEL